MVWPYSAKCAAGLWANPMQEIRQRRKGKNVIRFLNKACSQAEMTAAEFKVVMSDI
jgi:hypothetical protein